MVVRLLVVVLTLVGAIPVRICTCGAATTTHSLPSPPACRTAPRLQTGLSIIARTSSPAEHHDADCHVVKPRPLMSHGLQFDVVDVPPLDAIA